jgi:exodeoxyribonuclease VII small subunit
MINENFEKKIEVSKEILEKLSNSDVTLHESLKLYKDGLKELEDAQTILQEAKIEFEQISNLEKV